MYIYNTMTRKKESLTFEGDELKIYLCGPTVYNYIHIGNARTFCVFDTLRRYLLWRGVPVRMVMNFTDIDDRIIAGAVKDGVTAAEYAERYIKEFFTDCAGLHIMPPSETPRATQSIDIILKMIETLIGKGCAYVTDKGDVYFRTRRFGEYGKLSHQNVEELEEGFRIEPDENKEDPLDFALWKAAGPGEPHWDSLYGEGRPGWHIECSAMCRKFLGTTVDIHGGGLDLAFPHHENEIAQSESCNGEKFVRYWMHAAMINVDSRKMSKSLGNFFTVREINEEFGYDPIRFFIISSHYRSQANFSRKTLESCVTSLERLRNCRANLAREISSADGTGTDSEISVRAKEREAQFIGAMEDDLNTADALSALFELARDINSAEGQNAAALAETAEIFDGMCSVLGILQDAAEDSAPPEVQRLAEERLTARKDRNFAKADTLRDEISSLGFAVEDTKDGFLLKKL